jgi:DNA-binding NtrC family response regulator
LNVIPIYVPALRERREDILLLAQHFLKKFESRTGRKAILSKDCEAALEEYRWPGNVRELENVIERAAALSDGEVIESHDLPKRLFDGSTEEAYEEELPPEGIDLEAKVKEFEQVLIGRAMKKAVNSQTKAARLLRLTPRSLRYKLDKYNMKNNEN